MRKGGSRHEEIELSVVFGGCVPVDQWYTTVILTADICSRSLASKPNYTNGIAPIVLGAIGKLIEAVVERLDSRYEVSSAAEVAEIVRAVDSVNR